VCQFVYAQNAKPFTTYQVVDNQVNALLGFHPRPRVFSKWGK
jgi:hypothetical protein